METISCNKAATVPTECQRMGAKSGKLSRFLDNSNKTTSLCRGNQKDIPKRDRLEMDGTTRWWWCTTKLLIVTCSGSISCLTKGRSSSIPPTPTTAALLAAWVKVAISYHALYVPSIAPETVATTSVMVLSTTST